MAALEGSVRIGALINSSRSIDEVTAEVQRLADSGFASVWGSQTFAHDTLTLLAVVGAYSGVELGTAVVPIHPRHPVMLAHRPSPCRRPSRDAWHWALLASLRR